MIRAIVFDCFGVLYTNSYRLLAESFPDKRHAFEDLFKQHNYGYLNKDEYIECVARLANTTPQEIEKIIVSEYVFNKILFDYITTEIKPYYKVGLLSNIGRGWIENFFTKNQLHNFFDAVVLSGDEGVVKPHPQIYELMAERLGLPPEECLVVDDLLENSAGADAAGMHGIVYGSLRDMKIELSKVLHARDDPFDKLRVIQG